SKLSAVRIVLSRDYSKLFPRQLLVPKRMCIITHPKFQCIARHLRTLVLETKLLNSLPVDFEVKIPVRRLERLWFRFHAVHLHAEDNLSLPFHRRKFSQSIARRLCNQFATGSMQNHFDIGDATPVLSDYPDSRVSVLPCPAPQ